MANDSFSDLRIEYGDEPLRETDVPADPFDLLRSWLDAAAAARVAEPNGMALATCDREGQPHCRIVLLNKGAQLAANARAAATFWWPAPRNRQVRITGRVESASAADADAYFASRPRRAQLCSAASPQSRVVASRDELERRVDALEAQVGNGPVPRPAHWGGFVLVPAAVEFWQGREGRLHDRIRCVRDGAGWRRERLAP
jgi:pyridoxamine 5'-phosphate oxidase